MSTFRYRVQQYNPATGVLMGLGPAPKTVEAAAPLNDISSLSVTFNDPTNIVRAPAELAIEVSVDNGSTWSEPPNMRFNVIGDSRDRIKNPKYPTLSAPGMFWQLKKAVVFATVGQPLDADGRRAWASITPGSLIRTLIAEAQARGVLSWLDMSSFSSTTDSNGLTWPATFSTSHEIGIGYDAIIMTLADCGLIDFQMQGRALKVYAADTFLAPSAGSVVLTQGKDFTEASETTTYELVASRNLIIGDGSSTVVVDVAADKPWGDWEVTTSASGSTSTVDMALLADLGTARSSLRQVQRTFTAYPNATPTTPKPFVDYKVGDQIAARTDNTLEQNLRVRQITLRADGSSSLVTLVLGDRLLEREVRLSRLLKAAAGGIAGAGSNGTFPSQTTDTLSPSPPTTILFSSIAVFINDAVVADLTISWTAPTTNTNGTILDDLDHYEVQIKRTAGPAGSWLSVGTTTGVTLTAGSLVPGASYDARVRAVDRSGNLSSWLTGTFTTNVDGAAPQTPSTPVVVADLGMLIVTWDGKDSLGNDPSGDFRELQVHVSTSSGFTPSTSTMRDSITNRTGGRVPIADLVYATTYFVKTVAVDTSGNASTPSTQASGIPVRVTGLDVEALAIDTAAIADNAVTTLKINALAVTSAKIGNLQVLNAAIANLAVDDAKIANMSVGKLTVGTLSADITVSARIKTANTGPRVELNSSGLQAFNSTIQTVDISASTGNVSIVGTFKTGTTGRRIIMDPTGFSTIYFYPTTGSNYAYINAPDGSSGGATLGLNAATYTPSGTAVFHRLFLTDGTSDLEVVRASDQLAYGGYVNVSHSASQIGFFQTGANWRSQINLDQNKIQLTQADASNVQNSIEISDTHIYIITQGDDITIQSGGSPILLNSGGGDIQLDANAGGKIKMRGKFDDGAYGNDNSYKQGETGGSGNTISLGWGATMSSQMDTVCVNEAGDTVWCMTGSSSTGWSLHQAVNQGVNINFWAARR